MNLRFGTIYVMHPLAGEKLKDLHRLPCRDRYVGQVGGDDPELLAGRYDLWTLPDQSVMFTTGDDYDGYRAYQLEHHVPIMKDEKAFYQAIAQRAKNFINERQDAGQTIYHIGHPSFSTVFMNSLKTLANNLVAFCKGQSPRAKKQ